MKRLLSAMLIAALLCSGCGRSLDNPEAKAEALTSGAPSAYAPQINPENTPPENKLGDNTPISRALAAKMLSFINNDKNSIDLYERDISFSDTKAEDWHDRYINACAREGLMSGYDGNKFMPEKPLSLQEAQYLLEKIDSDNKIKLELSSDNKNKAISYALWTELYITALQNAAGEKDLAEAYGIKQDNIIVLATNDNNTKLKAGNVITATGAYTHYGISLKEYIDKSITVLYKDGEILAVTAIADAEPTITNAFIVSKTSDSITIFSGGAERTYPCDASGLENAMICDIKIRGSLPAAVETYTDTIKGAVKRINTSKLEIDEQGEYSLCADMKVYSTFGGPVKWKSLGNIIVGVDMAEFILKDGKICAAIITENTYPDKIRVLISTTGFSGYIHDEVMISSDRPFTVKSGGASKTYNAGEIYKLDKPSALVMSSFQRTFILPSEDAKLQILSIKRAWSNNESPSYRGVLEIGLETEGYSIVNELKLEEYLYAVIPSEMPTGYGLEAAKVQAVSARSFAYNQYFQNRYYKYGANADDSVMSQVYNNIPENDNSISAVNETAGLCLVYKGQVISANFFSTSAGMTANAGEVWSGSLGKQFPASTAEYLSAGSQLLDGSIPDLSVEKNAHSFFKNTDIESYDSSFAWFRWNVSMTAEELGASINANLKTRYEASPPLIKTLQPNGAYKSYPISSIGTLTDIEVTKRGQGGNIMELKLTGSQATIIVQTEYNIRMLLKPMQYLKSGKAIEIKTLDGSALSNYSLMPSAFFVFDKSNNASGALETITFYGGGMGHGVGMSQNGASGMIKLGKTFTEVLKHYYNGAEVLKMMP